MGTSRTEIEDSFDRVAEPFAAEFYGELVRKPFDRDLLDQFAKSVRHQGKVCEMGCGPGQVARYLQDRGLRMSGLDLSQEMVNLARNLNPDIPFQRGDMLALDIPAASLAGIISFYAIFHLKREGVQRALEGMHRALEPGGRLLISFHGGEGEFRRNEWYGRPVSIYITLFESEEMEGYLKKAGFEVESVVEREPYEFEKPMRRLYAVGRRPAPSDSR